MEANFLQLTIGAALMLMALSFVFKSTILFRFCEYTFIGASMGNVLVWTWRSLRTTALIPISSGSYEYIISVIFGLMLLTRLVPTYSWLARWPTAIMVGVGSGLAFRTIVIGQVINQIKATIAPGQFTGSAADVFGQIVLVVGVISTMWYFVFTTEKTGIKGKVSDIGRYIMMVGFGAAFANALQGRVTYVVNVVHFLLSDWLGLIH